MCRVSAEPIRKDSHGSREGSIKEGTRKMVGWCFSPLLDELPTRWQEQSWNLQSLPSQTTFPPLPTDTPTGEMQDVGVVGVCCECITAGPYATSRLK